MRQRSRRLRLDSSVRRNDGLFLSLPVYGEGWGGLLFALSLDARENILKHLTSLFIRDAFSGRCGFLF